jgi:hypothetical protein
MSTLMTLLSWPARVFNGCQVLLDQICKDKHFYFSSTCTVANFNHFLIGHVWNFAKSSIKYKICQKFKISQRKVINCIIRLMQSSSKRSAGDWSSKGSVFWPGMNSFVPSFWKSSLVFEIRPYLGDFCLANFNPEFLTGF